MLGLLLGLFNLGGAAVSVAKDNYDYNSYNNEENSLASTYSYEELQRFKENATNDGEWRKWRNIEVRKFMREKQHLTSMKDGRLKDLITGRPCYTTNDSIQGFCIYDGDKHCFIRKIEAKPWYNEKESIVTTVEQKRKNEQSVGLAKCKALCDKHPLFVIKDNSLYCKAIKMDSIRSSFDSKIKTYWFCCRVSDYKDFNDIIIDMSKKYNGHRIYNNIFNFKKYIDNEKESLKDFNCALTQEEFEQKKEAYKKECAEENKRIMQEWIQNWRKNNNIED